jgi:hypothetical protein
LWEGSFDSVLAPNSGVEDPGHIMRILEERVDILLDKGCCFVIRETGENEESHRMYCMN